MDNRREGRPSPRDYILKLSDLVMEAQAKLKEAQQMLFSDSQSSDSQSGQTEAPTSTT